MSQPHPSLNEEAAQRLARIELFVLDVDGTLTDGRVVYVDTLESQAFCVRDGQGLAWMRKAGVHLAWISGRGCTATERRARELDVEFVELRCCDKKAALTKIQAKLGLSSEQTLAMGDDLPDLALASRANFFAAPADACAEVRERADYVTTDRAGSGAVREVCELYLRAAQKWNALLDASQG